MSDATTDDASEELELPEAELDETALPALDTDDPEAQLQEANEYGDLLDSEWLQREVGEREEDEDGEDESAYVEVGLTIDLNGPETGEELSRVVDLDVGALITSLPNESVEADQELSRELAASLAAHALNELGLPEPAEQGAEHAEEEHGDDERFPAFDDSLIVRREPPVSDDSDGGTDDDGTGY